MKEKLCYQIHVTEAVSCCYVCWESQFKRCTVKTSGIKRRHISIFMIQRNPENIVHSVIGPELYSAINRTRKLHAAAKHVPPLH